MIKFDDHANKNKTEHNLKLSCTFHYPCTILIIGSSGSGKTNALLNLINNHLDKICLHVKNSYEGKYQFLINKRESTELKHFNDRKAFIEFSNHMQDVYKNIEEYNIDKKCKILIVLDDMIVYMINNKKPSSIVTKLFIRGTKLNISIVFITKSYFKVPQDVRLSFTHFFILKISNKRELQQIALNHSPDIEFKDFIKIYEKFTPELYYFLANDATLP